MPDAPVALDGSQGLCRVQHGNLLRSTHAGASPGRSYTGAQNTATLVYQEVVNKPG
jgi:hypothetical protein